MGISGAPVAGSGPEDGSVAISDRVLLSGVSERGMTIPAFLSVDVEPDAFQLSRRDPQGWKGYRATIEVVERLRSALSARIGASPRFGWYVRMDPQIAEVYGRPEHVLTAFPDQVARLQAGGDYFGVHAHAIRWSEHHQLWVHDFEDASWHTHSTRFALDAYARWAGAPARRFRSGAGFLTNGIVDVIDQCGVKVDLTLEPVSGWGLTASAITAGADSSPIFGAYTDCHTAPRVPYRPARQDFRVRARRDGRDVVMIPLATSILTASQPLWRRTAKWLLGRRPQAQVLYPGAGWPSGSAYWDLVERQLSSMPRPYLSIAIRTDRPESAAAPAVRRIFEALPQHRLAARLCFTDPLEVVDRLV